jgi:Lon protease-like protein
MTHSFTPDELAAMPVFPLPRVVWFPATTLPLHVFEPRYRRMFADSFAGAHTAMAVAQLRPGWRGNPQDPPPIHEIAGAGRITRHRENSDGTYDVELSGIARVRLHELDPGDLPYRRARAELLLDRSPVEGVPRSDLGALWSLASQIAREIQHVDAGFTLRVSPSDTASVLIDRIADQLVTEPDMRQKLLETLDLPRRAELARAQIARLHLALLATAQADTRVLH